MQGSKPTKEILFPICTKYRPAVSAMDIAFIRPPYIHFRRKADEYILYVILDGEMFLREGINAYHLRPGDCILLDPLQTHEGIKSSVCRFLYVHFDAEIVNADPQTDGTSEKKKKRPEQGLKGNEEEDRQDIFFLPKHFSISSAESMTIIRELSEEAARVVPEGQIQTMWRGGLFLQLLSVLQEEVGGQKMSSELDLPQEMSKVIGMVDQFLRKNSNRALSESDLSRRFGYHYDYLNRCYKKAMHCTIFQALLRIRMKNAKKLLSSGYYSVSETADLVGFTNLSSFSRAFKKQTGQSPAEYKKSQRKE